MRGVLSNVSRKEHTMRKSISALLSAAVVAVAMLGGTSLAGPASAQAAGCKWQMPTRATIVQGNNHRVYLAYLDGYWQAKAYNRNTHTTTSTEVAFRSFTPRLVKFIITWWDDTAGVYTASIDSDGFVSGTTRDRFNPGSKASWHMTTLARRGR
jgi:hypothetical protein